MAKHEASSLPNIDTLTIRSIGVDADADVRSVQKELERPGSVRGRAGERIRAALVRRGLRESSLREAS
ncbi:MAG TPA: hypothetical protein VH142_03230 [Polyangiaceae bacterium]|nr:hypothetical protein [Polyangiaceae bacterium]